MKIYVKQRKILILFEFLISALFYIITSSKMELINRNAQKRHRVQKRVKKTRTEHADSEVTALQLVLSEFF